MLLQKTVILTARFSKYQWLPRPSRGRGTATLVANKITCTVHSLIVPEIEHVMIEIPPGSISQQSVCILNV